MSNNVCAGSGLGLGSLLTHSTPRTHIYSVCESAHTHAHDLTICAHAWTDAHKQQASTHARLEVHMSMNGGHELSGPI